MPHKNSTSFRRKLIFVSGKGALEWIYVPVNKFDKNASISVKVLL